MPQLDVGTYASQLFWLVISFSILWIGLRRMLPLLLEALVERECFLVGEIQKAKKFEEQSSRIKKDQEAKLELSRQDMKAKLEEATHSAHEYLRLKKQKALQESHRHLDEINANHEKDLSKATHHLSEHTDLLLKKLLSKIDLCYPSKTVR